MLTAMHTLKRQIRQEEITAGVFRLGRLGITLQFERVIGPRPEQNRDFRGSNPRTRVRVRLCNGKARQAANFYSNHREHGAMAVASLDERQSADAVVASRGPLDAEGSNRSEQRQVRSE